jgi:hypothetical protein
MMAAAADRQVSPTNPFLNSVLARTVFRCKRDHRIGKWAIDDGRFWSILSRSFSPANPNPAIA